MIRFCVLLTLVALLITGTGPAHACEAGDGKDLCATKNGHYRILLPKGSGPHPTVVYLYGSTGQSSQLASSYSPLQLFAARGYAVIVPAALDVNYNDPRFGSGRDSGWHLRNERRRNARNETAFVDEVLNDAALRHRINKRRVLITGQSRGASLTWEIACHNPQLANAYAPHAGLYFGEMPKSCKRPVRILHAHGRADDVVPLAPSKRTKFHTPVRDALNKIGAAAGCTHPGTKKQFKDYERTTWWGCQAGSSAELLLHNGGHNIPASWYTTVIDWFEQGGPATTQGVSGGTARFSTADEGNNAAGSQGSSSRFKSSTGGGSLLPGSSRSNSRFKKAKVPSQ